MENSNSPKKNLRRFVDIRCSIRRITRWALRTVLFRPLVLGVLSILLMPSITWGEKLKQPRSAVQKMVIVELDACCPQQRWQDGEENVAKELALQDIQTKKGSAQSPQNVANETWFLQTAKEHNAQGTLVVHRSEQNTAVIRYLVYDESSEKVLFRQIFIKDITNPDAAVMGAIRAVEAIVAGFGVLLRGTDAEILSPQLGEEVSQSTSPFGTVAAPDAFVKEIPKKDPSEESGSQEQAESDEPQSVDKDKNGDDTNAATKTKDNSNNKPDEQSPDSQQTTDSRDDDAPSSTEQTQQAFKQSRPLAPRWTLFLGGDFAFSSTDSGVRRGFDIGSMVRIFSGLFASVDVGFLPFGPVIQKWDAESEIMLLKIQGWLGWHFIPDKRIRPSLRIGAGTLMGFAEGLNNLVGETKNDVASVAIVSAAVDVRLSITDRIAAIAGLALGTTFPAMNLKHQGESAAKIGRPLFVWTINIEITIF